MATLGIDIGGTGIKGALVDTRRGVLTTDRVRIKTPKPAKPDDVLAVVADVAQQAGAATNAVGLTFPGVVTNGIVRTAVHLHRSWIGVKLADLATERLGRPTTVLNDADAAGVAEVAHGAAKGNPASYSCSPSARVSAAGCSSTAPSCPTPSWDTCPSTKPTPRA